MQDTDILNSYEINSADVIKAIIKFEKKPINPDNINKIKVIETHISSIYLTQKFAYKQKKKVNFGFLDYTSLEKRKFYCRKELSLNRRSCAGIYLDMPELRLKNDGSLLLGYKKGKIIDYLVRMKRVADVQFLDAILAKDKEKRGKKRCGFDDKGEDINNIDNVNDIVINSNTDINIETETNVNNNTYIDIKTETDADIYTDIDKILQKTAKRIYLFHKNANSSKRISMFGKIDVLKENFDDNYSAVYNFISEEKELNFDALNNINNIDNAEDKINNINSANNTNNTNSANSINKINNVNNINYLNALKKINNQNNQNNLKKLNNIFYDFINSDEFAQYITLRISKGLVKDCHGDLRMEHIVIGNISKNNGICILDCVEFSEKLRFQDVYLDFAFLLMDMEHRGYFYESGKIFEYYKNYFSAGLINLFQEYEFKVILAYKLYRALVRCKIAILQTHGENNKTEQGSAAQITSYKYNKNNNKNHKTEENKENNDSKENVADKLNEAANYFNLAMFYAELLAKPVIVMNVGLPGSGKSALSFLLSRYLNASLLTSDKIRKELFASKDVYLYDKSISRRVYEYIFEESKKAVELKKNVVMDATFLEAGHRKIFIDYFTKKYCNFIVIYSKIYKENENIIIERLKSRKTKSDFKSAESSESFECPVDRSLHTDCQTAGNSKTDGFAKDYSEGNSKSNDFTKDYSDADEEVYLRMKKTLDEPVSQSGGAAVLTIDASIELKDRYNCVLAQLLKMRG